MAREGEQGVHNGGKEDDKVPFREERKKSNSEEEERDQYVEGGLEREDEWLRNQKDAQGGTDHWRNRLSAQNILARSSSPMSKDANSMGERRLSQPNIFRSVPSPLTALASTKEYSSMSRIVQQTVPGGGSGDDVDPSGMDWAAEDASRWGTTVQRRHSAPMEPEYEVGSVMWKLRSEPSRPSSFQRRASLMSATIDEIKNNIGGDSPVATVGHRVVAFVSKAFASPKAGPGGAVSPVHSDNSTTAAHDSTPIGTPASQCSHYHLEHPPPMTGPGIFLRAASTFAGSTFSSSTGVQSAKDDKSDAFGRTQSNSSVHSGAASTTSMGGFGRLASTFSGESSGERGVNLTPFLLKHSFFGKDNTVESMLKSMDVNCNDKEKLLIQEAFTCPVCNAQDVETMTISDQMRAVHEAFMLIDADGDKFVSLRDLDEIWQWSSVWGDVDNKSFLLDFKESLYQIMGDSLAQETPIGLKHFLLAFALTLVGVGANGVNTSSKANLENRHTYYRGFGRLFGIEKIHQRFRWNKFWLTMFSDSLAFIAIPVCKLNHLIWGYQTNSLYDKLTEAQWLPAPYTSFDSFHMYLCKLWIPAWFSAFVYVFFGKGQTGITNAEIIHPLVLYLMIGGYISTVSGYEHNRMVLRRLNQALSRESQQDELHAIFAFRAHTPEGHAVEQMGYIADVLFSTSYRWISSNIAALLGFVHTAIPPIQRMMFNTSDTCEVHQSQISHIYWLLTGGNTWFHLLASVPATVISGYLTYRLIFITSVCFYNDLAFYNKLLLFRASTTAESFLRNRARWIRAQAKKDGLKRKDFMKFLNLQRHDDLLLWCRIRQLLVDTYSSGFKSTQGDIIVTYMLLSVLAMTTHIFIEMGRSKQSTTYTVFDLRARLEVVFFSIILILIINLKLSIHSLRKSDVYLLHNEHYLASVQGSTAYHAQKEGISKSAAGRSFNAWGSTAGSMGSLITATKGDSPDIVPGRRRSWVDESEPPPPTRSASDLLALRAGDAVSQDEAANPPRNPRVNRLESGDGEQLAFGRREGEEAKERHAANFGNASQQMSTDVQVLMERTARHIEMFDKPPRLLSFTVSIQFLRYIFLPLLSPIFAALRAYGNPNKTHHHHR